MPLTPRKTTPGIPLHSEFVGGESDTIREIPPEWRAALDITVEQVPMPWDRPIIPLSDTVLASKAEQQYTSERTMRTTYKPPGVFHLFESFTDKHKQLGVRDRSFHFIDDWPGVVPSPTGLTDVETRNFGNKHFELRVDTLPGLFGADEFCEERSVVTPPDFRALLGENSHCQVEFGTASAPPDPLPAGVIKWCDNQEDVYTHKVCITSIDLTTIPQTINNKETNARKQFVSVDRTLELDTTIPAVPTALMSVEFTKLGDGTALEIHKTDPSLFTEQSFEKSRPEVWPERFRAQSPLATDVHRVIGIAADPTLVTGDVRKREQQEDVFVKRVEASVRTLPSLPTPHLHGQRYEDTFDIVLPYDEWVDTAGANIGVPRTVVVPQGDGTEQVEQIDFASATAALDAYSLVFPGTTNLNSKLPDVLSELESVFEENYGNGSYSETGSGYWSIRGSYALSIRGSGNASAAVVADATFLLLPAFKPAVRTTRVVFFLPNPVTSASVLTKLSTILGVTVSDWPAFDPTPVTVVCTSRKVSVRAEANQHTQSGGSSIVGTDGDPCGTPDCVSCDAASTTGTGTSTEVGITIKTIRIPTCLHGLINLHDTHDRTATAEAYAFDGSSWGSCVPPEFGPADTGPITLTATGKVDCDAPATSVSSYPTGTFLLDTSAQPYKYGYAMIHAEVVTL